MQTCVEKEKLDQSEDMAMVPALPIPGGAIARMQTLLETLPKQEKKAAEFLLDNLQSFSSQSIQGYLQQRLLRLGRMCALLTDPYEMEVQSGMVDADTLVIVTSRTGWPSSLFDACSKAKAHGAKVCVLSGQKDSKLAKIADYTLLTSTRSFKPSVVTSGVATFAVIDALFVMASLIQQDDSDESDEE